jgi:polyhydroxyalkanoate synthesis regulator phasin
MKYCNDSHKQAVVAYSGQECPLCVSNRRLIEMADAQEDIDKQNIQELWNEVDALQKRLKALEGAVMPVTEPNIWTSHLLPENG